MGRLSARLAPQRRPLFSVDRALEGLLLPQPPGKHYRLLKIVTRPATASQFARLGNDRAPVVRSTEVSPAGSMKMVPTTGLEPV